MQLSSVFVAGAGFMGSAIAYLVASKTSDRVTLYDIHSEALSKAQSNINKIGQSAVEKGFISSGQWQGSLERIKFSGSLNDVCQAGLVIEAIAEDLTAKQELFAVLDKMADPSCLFASNTSSLSITALASATQRTAKFIGMHFFSPAHIMKLIEVIPGVDTASTTIEQIAEYARQLGKTVITSKDMPGFITTRLGLVLVNEAAFALMEGLSSASEIDTGMTLGYNHPMGPLALADFIGLDICLHIMETLWTGYGDPKYRPCPLIRQLVVAGHLGRKTGRGFYEYDVAK